MTVFFNFFGGPGTGKSTTATYCFSMSKDDQFNAEYVPEKAKDWAWEKRNIKLVDQFELFKKQTVREERLIHEAGVAFADSPVWLCAYYASLQGKSHVQKTFEELCQEYYQRNAQNGVVYYNIWLTRIKPFNPKGRFQTETQAKLIDQQMKPYLEDLGIEFLTLPGDKYQVYPVIRQILANHPQARVEE